MCILFYIEVELLTLKKSAQIQAVISCSDMVPKLVNLLSNADKDIKKEAAWALANATSGGTPEQNKYLVDCGIIPPMCALLHETDAKVVLVALEALENLLKTSPKDENGFVYSLLIEESGGVDRLETLQHHHNNEVYEKALRILENFFETMNE